MAEAKKYGVMICGHGSRSQSAVAEFANASKKLGTMFGDWPVEYGYLEFANPVIRTGLDKLREQGVNHVLAVPGMLFAAGHAKNDIPSVLNAYAEETGITIQYGRELAVDLNMIQAAGERIQEAVDKANAELGEVPVHETCLVVIGRGASDPDANSNVSKIARMLWEGMGFGWCEVGYSGVTFPLVEPCLDHVARLGYRRVLVFPYFLFSGILIDRIYGFADVVAARHPDMQFIKAGYLNDHPKVLATFKARVHEIIEGSNHMNCSLCKYRSNLFGFEKEVGLVQESHHDHVEGLGISCDLCDAECNGACESNSQNLIDEQDHLHFFGKGDNAEHQHKHVDHHHSIYPNSKHPLGPVTLRLLSEDQILRNSVEKD